MIDCAVENPTRELLSTRFVRCGFLFAATLLLCGQALPQLLQPELARQPKMSSLSLEEKVGQMLQARIFLNSREPVSLSEVQQLDEIQKLHIGSVDVRDQLVGLNLRRPMSDVAARELNSLQSKVKIPLLIGSDIERGVIARVGDAPDFPTAMAWSATGDVDTARQIGEITGREARAVGIQWAFAPVADVNDNPDNPVIGDRSFGGDPNWVSKMVASYIVGAHAGGLLVTAKHFPGHGDPGMDSHVDLVTLNQSLEHLRKVEFAPFRAAIAEGVDAVMLAHERIPALDPDPNKIATTSSKVIQGYLRGELGFKGVVITDAMEMRGLTDLYKGDPHAVEHASIDAIKAGADIIMLSDHVDEVYEAILAAVKKGEISESRINQSVARIMTMKDKAGLFANRSVDTSKVDGTFSTKADKDYAQNVSDNAVVLVRDEGKLLPLPDGSPSTSPRDRSRKLALIIFTDAFQSPLGRVFESEVRILRPDVLVRHIYYNHHTMWDSSDFIGVARESDTVILAAFMTNLPGKKAIAGGKVLNVFGLNGPYAQMFDDIVRMDPKKVVVISLGSPYLILHHTRIENYLCTFSVSSTSERAAVKALFGKIQNKARLPVDLPGIASRGFAIPWPQPAGNYTRVDKH